MILVTGGTGLVGSHLLAELVSRGYRVRALKRVNSDTTIVTRILDHYKISRDKHTQIDWIEGDVEDYQSLISALLGAHTVYHCAAMVSFSRSDFKRMLEINVQGTANVVDACIEVGVRNFCHVSSIASLGSSVEGAEVDEGSVWGKTKGKSGYAISKFLSEMEVWRGFEEGLNTVIVNPSVVIGPGKWSSGSGMLFGTIESGFPFFTLGVTGYVDVRDVAECMVKVIDKELWGKRFILNGQNISHKEVFEIIAKAIGKKPPHIEAKPWMSSLAWPFVMLASRFTSKTSSLTRETARSGYSKTYYSSKLAQKELAINFHPISEAVANTVSAGRL